MPILPCLTVIQLLLEFCHRKGAHFLSDLTILNADDAEAC